MKQKILFVGLDVDSKLYHSHAIDLESKKKYSFSCLAKPGDLLKKLNAYVESGYSLRVCYEASFIGFSLQRVLSENGIHCDVIAASMIPQMPGDRVKTDRVDAEKLARFYANGLLKVVYVPHADEEADRELLRTRQFLQNETSKIRNHITALCHRLGLDFRADTDCKNYWTKEHMKWLHEKQWSVASPAMRLNLKLLLDQLDKNEQILDEYTQAIEELSQKPIYKEKVRSLMAFRGLKMNTAMTLVLEIGEVNRFKHPKNLVSYAGLDIAERSSGGNQRRMGITRTGNKYMRTALVIAAQYSMRQPRVSRLLAKRREESSKREIEIADRCMKRLYKKSMRLMHKGKHINKVKVACAREMIGFIWETLSEARAA